MSRRKVTREELELWNRVTRTAEKLDQKQNLSFEVSKPVREADQRFEINDPLVIGSKATRTSPGHDLLPQLTQRLPEQPVQMDKKTHQRLKSGKLTPEGRLDLHGLTLAQAQPRLTEFILKNHSQGKRLVLVITGKGKNTDDGGPIPVRHGILRHAVPQWLGQAPLSAVVLQLTQAHGRHGGGGAYYVYLRRSR